MNTILVCSSEAHGNTRQIADVIAKVLDARVLSPSEATPEELARADRVGLGSGIYWMAFHPQLSECVQGLPDMTGRDAFIFATRRLAGATVPALHPHVRPGPGRQGIAQWATHPEV